MAENDNQIDWSLPRKEFGQGVKAFLDKAVEKNKTGEEGRSNGVLFPIFPKGLKPEQAITKVMYMIQPYLECDNCDGRCCKLDTYVHVTNTEWEDLKKNVRYEYWTKIRGVLRPYRKNFADWEFNLPCPMLKDNKCLIYEHRFMACRHYPVIDVAEKDGGKWFILALECPSAPSIAMRACMAIYDKRQREEEGKQ